MRAKTSGLSEPHDSVMRAKRGGVNPAFHVSTLMSMSRDQTMQVIGKLQINNYMYCLLF